MERRPPHSSRRRSRDRRRERRHLRDRRLAPEEFDGQDRRVGSRRQPSNRRAEDPAEFYAEEVERIQANVVGLLRRHRQGPVPHFSCPRCDGHLSVHQPVRWAEVTVFEVTCSECPRRAVIKNAPSSAPQSRGMFGLLRKLFG